MQANEQTDQNQQTILGLHHITAMAGDPQRNLNFYTHVLGQRLVKTTVNFDDPTTYHFYYADDTGTPGTVITFFPWPRARRGRIGTGEASAVTYAIPTTALDYWRDRLARFGVTTGGEQTRFGATVLPLLDPDGMTVELVAVDSAPAVNHWPEGPIPAEYALRGFHSTTLHLADAGPTRQLLTGLLGFSEIGREGERIRFAAPNQSSGGIGQLLDLLILPDVPRGALGVGSIHHIAFRVPNDAAQQAWRARLLDAGLRVTEVADRQYFRSIYFREPGGVLFEFATDAPGFLVDESRDELGTNLRLPPWYEARRAEIEQALPPLDRTQQDIA